MFDAARHGERGGHGCRPLPVSAGRLVLALSVLAVLWIAPARARADGMYRCVGASGETVFTSSRAGYSHCHAIQLPRQDTTSKPVVAPVGGVPDKAAAPGKAKTGSGGATPTTYYRQGTATRAPKLPPASVRKGARVLRGAVYKVEHADGSVEYTNVRPRGSRARGTTMRTLFTYISTCAACDVHSRIDWAHVPLRLAAYAATIRKAAARYGVDPALVRAVIHAESAFNPRAMSAKGAQGLMQLMPATASSMGVDDAFDPRQNIRGGAQYLAQLSKTFHGDDRLVAAAYNAGPDAVQKYGGVPPYAETEVYVQRVTLLHHRYSRAMRQVPKVAGASAGKAN